MNHEETSPAVLKEVTHQLGLSSRLNGRSATWRRLCLILLLLHVSAASAQMNQPRADPFEGLNAEIVQVADERLAQLGQLRSLTSHEVLVSNTPVPASANFCAFASSDRVRTAALHLEALGVDGRKIFQVEGVPVDFLTVAAVESGFNPHALSPKGALGIWQFMPATARRYGLRVGQQTDDRLNPERETRAAARYLRDLHFKLGDWPLALAAYNVGEDKVRKAMERNGITDYWTLSQLSLLPQETRNYVPSVLSLVGAADKEAIRSQWKHPSDVIGKGIEIFAETDNNH